MTNTGGTPAGWYHAPGDPEGTQRYWDGAQWIGDPQAVPQAPAAPQAPEAPQAPQDPDATVAYAPPAAAAQPPQYGAPPAAGQQPPAAGQAPQYGAAPGGQQPPAFGAPPPGAGAPPGYTAFGGPGAAAQTGDLAEGWQRVVARLIDGVIWFFIGLVFTLVGGGSALATGGSDGNFFVFAIASLAGVAAVTAYEVFMTTKTGNTLGKKVFNLKIVNVDGSAVDEKTMVMRMITYIAAGVVGVIPILGLIGLLNVIVVIVSLVFLFTDPMRQAIWDKIAKTKVIVTA